MILSMSYIIYTCISDDIYRKPTPSDSLREEPSQKNLAWFIGAFACGFARLRAPAKQRRNAFAAKVGTALLTKSLHLKKKRCSCENFGCFPHGFKLWLLWSRNIQNHGFKLWLLYAYYDQPHRNINQKHAEFAAGKARVCSAPFSHLHQNYASILSHQNGPTQSSKNHYPLVNVYITMENDHL